MKEKVEIMKPILLKAGLPLSLTLAGFLFSVIIRRKRGLQPPKYHHGNNREIKDQEISDTIDSASLCNDETEEAGQAVVKRVIDDRPNLEEQIEGLKGQLSDLQDREGELEVKFLHFCSLQEFGSALKELQNALELEMAHVELLGLKVEAAGAENRRLEALVAEYQNAVKKLQSANSEVGLLRQKVKKLRRVNKKGVRLLCQNALLLKSREAEILSKNEQLQWKERKIKESEDVIADLKRALDQLGKEKQEIVQKMELAENSVSSISRQNEAEEMMAEEHNQLCLEYEKVLTQLEHIQKKQAAYVDELIHLRWTNDCLRQELTKSREQRPADEEAGRQVITEFAGNNVEEHCNAGFNSDSLSLDVECGKPHTDINTTKQTDSSKPLLLHKLKRWVKGKEKQRSCGKEYQEKCSTMCPASDEALEDNTATNPCPHAT